MHDSIWIDMERAPMGPYRDHEVAVVCQRVLDGLAAGRQDADPRPPARVAFLLLWKHVMYCQDSIELKCIRKL